MPINIKIKWLLSTSSWHWKIKVNHGCGCKIEIVKA